jgi:hypothetical protein
MYECSWQSSTTVWLFMVQSHRMKWESALEDDAHFGSRPMAQYNTWSKVIDITFYKNNLDILRTT